MKKPKRKPRRLFLKIYNVIDRIKFVLGIKPKTELIIVTGADSSHFKPLCNLLNSIMKYEPDTTVIVYDLGLSKSEHYDIKNHHIVSSLIRFDYDNYPAFFNIKKNSGEYAWKGVIIEEVMETYKAAILWLDAGCLLTRPLFQIRKYLDKHGFYSPFSKGVIKDYTHPKTIELLNCPEEHLLCPNLSSGSVGIDYRFSEVVSLIKEFSNYSKNKEFIAPEGSDRSNHRQDQAVLTLLAYKYGLIDKMPNRCLGFVRHQDIG